jgi:hypothetical protein
MIVTKKGKYRFLKDFVTRGSFSTGTIPKNTVIEITQIDLTNNKVIGPEFFDWAYWDLPVEEIK